ncbi:P-loop containing nucleoside triphosphate hydrolase protein [Dichotomocladium elegans]|nr:P-loop containing nucleoside triphosphate hydrolase protein [Dichotomocladium elegans]
MAISHSLLAPPDSGIGHRARSPSVSSVSSSTSNNIRLYPPRPTMSTSRTITTLTPSVSTYNRRKSSVSSITSSTSTVVSASNSASGGENVKVMVRCRPMTQTEFLNKVENSWIVDSNTSTIRLSEHGVNQRRREGRGIEHYYGTESEPGVIPRSVESVFQYIEKATDKEFVLRVSYLEIYNETIRDLLAPANDNLKIHEDKRRGIYVSPLTEEVVTSPMDVMSIIEKGEANRHISTTDYNLHSSRSHTIFQMIIESRNRGPNSLTSLSQRSPLRKEAMKISQLNLIDLAGSEKAATNTDRRKEGSYINKSNAGHVPFRDSKLTRILQPALSGQAKVVVICTISPASNSIEESANTLKFASRVLNDRALLQKYRGEITELKNKLDAANDVLRQEKENSMSLITAERAQKHEQQMRQMRLVRAALKDRIDQLTRLILTSSSVTHRQAASDDNASVTSGGGGRMLTEDPTETQNENPWDIVRELRRELAQVKASKASTEKLLADSQQRIKELEIAVEDHKSLIDQVAHLEAELSITRAELQMTTVLVHESSTSTSSVVRTPSDDSTTSNAAVRVPRKLVTM